MGQLLKENPQNLDLLGAGRRASTLRSGVRGVKKFLGWLAAAHGLSFQKSWRYSSEYLQLRLAEPCVRGALKHTHSCRIFLQEVAGVSIKHTDKALSVGHQKRDHGRGAARPSAQAGAAVSDRALGCTGRSHQGPGSETVLESVRLVGVGTKPWGTLRFDDHRGILPSGVVADSSGMHAKLTRSKVSGPDKKVVFRIVVVDAGAFVQHRDWFVVRWKVLCEAAPCERDVLMPTPTNNCKGCRYAELQSHTALAIQSRIIAHAAYRGQRMFNSATPSGRNYLRSAAAV